MTNPGGSQQTSTKQHKTKLSPKSIGSHSVISYYTNGVKWTFPCKRKHASGN